MNWKGKKVLVTGAGGFIGSHLAERLAGLGAQTRALIHYRSDGSWGWLERSSFADRLDVVMGDVRDAASVSRAVQGVEVVFHLAALIAIPYSYEAPVSYVRTNVEGTFNTLQAAKDAGVERIVHTSTSEVYGTARYVPIDEAHPLQAQSPYAATKIAADKMAEAFHLSFGLPVVTLRPFNTFGPRQSARAVIPTIITQCLREGRVRLGNVHPTRDFNYVANTVDGFLAAASSPGAIGRTVNVGSGIEIRIEELVEMIGRLIGKRVIIETDEKRRRPEASEVERLLANTRAAEELLAWKPAVTLEEGLRLTVGWMQEHLELYRAGIYAL